MDSGATCVIEILEVSARLKRIGLHFSARLGAHSQLKNASRHHYASGPVELSSTRLVVDSCNHEPDKVSELSTALWGMNTAPNSESSVHSFEKNTCFARSHKQQVDDQPGWRRRYPSHVEAWSRTPSDLIPNHVDGVLRHQTDNEPPVFRWTTSNVSPLLYLDFSVGHYIPKLVAGFNRSKAPAD